LGNGSTSISREYGLTEDCETGQREGDSEREMIYDRPPSGWASHLMVYDQSDRVRELICGRSEDGIAGHSEQVAEWAFERVGRAGGMVP